MARSIMLVMKLDGSQARVECDRTFDYFDRRAKKSRLSFGSAADREAARTAREVQATINAGGLGSSARDLWDIQTIHAQKIRMAEREATEQKRLAEQTFRERAKYANQMAREAEKSFDRETIAHARLPKNKSV